VIEVRPNGPQSKLLRGFDLCIASVTEDGLRVAVSNTGTAGACVPDVDDPLLSPPPLTPLLSTQQGEERAVVSREDLALATRMMITVRRRV
jgi:hypothetical protein